MKTTVLVRLEVNAPAQEAWELIDDWVGRTAPVEVDTITTKVVYNTALLDALEES